jgi:hypothetical protein
MNLKILPFLCFPFLAAAECSSSLLKTSSNDGNDVYILTLPSGVEKKVQCDGEWILLADFGRDRGEVAALNEKILSHEAVMKESGWRVSKGLKIFDENMDTPIDKLGFYSTGESDGYLSFLMPDGFSDLKIVARSRPFIVDKRNKIVFNNVGGKVVVWEEEQQGIKKDIVIEDVGGDSEVTLVEGSGYIEIDKVWVK